eukprot:3420760-Rhodomonas_salina.1
MCIRDREWGRKRRRLWYDRPPYAPMGLLRAVRGRGKPGYNGGQPETGVLICLPYISAVCGTELACAAMRCVVGGLNTRGQSVHTRGQGMVLARYPPTRALRDGAPYAMSGTDVAYGGGIGLRAPYAMSGTDMANTRVQCSGTDMAHARVQCSGTDTTPHARVHCPVLTQHARVQSGPPSAEGAFESGGLSPIRLRPCYAMSGTDVAYAVMRCPVLTSRKLLRNVGCPVLSYAMSIFAVPTSGMVVRAVRY